MKILLIGNSGVGKSSILMRYNTKNFVPNYYSTIGVDYVCNYSYSGNQIRRCRWKKYTLTNCILIFDI